MFALNKSFRGNTFLHECVQNSKMFISVIFLPQTKTPEKMDTVSAGLFNSMLKTSITKHVLLFRTAANSTVNC